MKLLKYKVKVETIFQSYFAHLQHSKTVYSVKVDKEKIILIFQYYWK